MLSTAARPFTLFAVVLNIHFDNNRLNLHFTGACDKGIDNIMPYCEADFLPIFNIQNLLQWGSWNNSLNWRKVFKCLNFI